MNLKESTTYQEMRLFRWVHAGANMLLAAVVSPRQHTSEMNAPFAPPRR